MSVYGVFREFLFLGFLLALFAPGKMVHYFLTPSYLAVTRLVSGCCMWITANWILRETDSGYMFCISTRRFWTNVAHFLRVKWIRILRCSVSVLSRMEKCAQQMLQLSVLACELALGHLKSTSTRFTWLVVMMAGQCAGTVAHENWSR